MFREVFVLLQVVMVVNCLRFGHPYSLKAANSFFSSSSSSFQPTMMSEVDSPAANSGSKALLLASGFTNRGEANAYILELEKTSPIISNALSSDHISGSWNLLYSGSLTDPGLLLYQVAKSLPLSKITFGDLVIDISEESTASSRCTAKIGEDNVDIIIDTKLEASGKDGMGFKEVYSAGKVGSFNIPFPAEMFSSLTRELIVTYLDKDLMIVRDQFGCPDVLQKTLESAAGEELAVSEAGSLVSSTEKGEKEEAGVETEKQTQTQTKEDSSEDVPGDVEM